jgi:23S rRNA pseudouridine2605 synthase
VCDELITAGRVTVDGVVAEPGTRVDPEQQQIAVDGTPVSTRTDLVYYLLNKPCRVMTTAHDPEGRPTVLELVPAEPRVFPVGRLDYDTEGLLLLTNDGELTQLLTHPRHGVAKTYLVEVRGVPNAAAVRTLKTGVDLEDGTTAPARVRVVGRHRDRTAIELTIHEGRNRQVRRMCEAIGHPVQRLVRTRVGPLRDDRLAPGKWRDLKPSEVRRLYADAVAAAEDQTPNPTDPN